MKSQELIDYAASLDCVHCGLCLRTCPTYQLTGRESASPRGRIHMMRSVAEGSMNPDASFIDELDMCLGCLGCESVCPSGVDYAHMLEFTRDALSGSSERPWLARLALRFGLKHVLTSRKAISLCALLLRGAQHTGLLSWVGGALGQPGRALAQLPPVPSASQCIPLPARTAAEGEAVAQVAVLEGCVMPELLGRVNRATVHVLAAAKRDVHAPGGPACCGSLQAHNGELDTARHLARGIIDAFDGLQDANGEPLPIVVNSAGCSAHMKGYGRLLEDDPQYAQRATQLAARVYDFSEYLARFAMEELKPRLTQARVAAPITWDDPCHLCHGQGVRSEPRTLLDVLQVERVELAESESCCGSAGLYSALRPEDSSAILAPRLDALEDCDARTLVTANPGCQLQWQSGVTQRELEVEVLHLAELLERSLKAR